MKVSMDGDGNMYHFGNNMNNLEIFLAFLQKMLRAAL